MIEKYFSPKNLESALELLSTYQDRAKIISGGTDLMVEFEKGQRSTVDVLIDITKINAADVRDIRQDSDGWIHIGPLVTHNDAAVSKLLQTKAFVLAKACWSVGSSQIRNSGTIAGNLITASPANDSIPALMALDARVKLKSKGGEREIPLVDFYTGVRRTVLNGDEILIDITFNALTTNHHSTFEKIGLRKGQAISVANLALVVEVLNNKIKNAAITLGSVAPTIIHAIDAENYLKDKEINLELINTASDLVVNAISPISDIRSSKKYRQSAAKALLRRALSEIIDGTERKNFPARPITLRAPNRKPDTSHSDTPIEFNENTPLIVTINGKVFTFFGMQNGTLLDLLRDSAHLKGTKEGCREGECGACTVIMNGITLNSCMVPAPRTHGAEIITVEAIGKKDKLHPLQQAFINKGAVQCGACTPGMVVSGVALLEETKGEHLNRKDILTALSGNLCRCTGYSKIVDAIIETSEKIITGDEVEDIVIDSGHTVGSPMVRIDAREKVTGNAIFAGDIEIPNLAVGLTVRSPHPYAKVISIDTSEAQKLPGVIAILTAKDIPGAKYFGITVKDQQVLAQEEVRYIGEPVALIAAQDEATANEAAYLIHVKYELKEPTFALQDTNAVNENPREYGKLYQSASLRRGDVRVGYQEAAVLVEDRFQTQEVEHAYLETEACVAQRDEDTITVRTCTQNPHYKQREIAAILGIPDSQVRVIQTVTGGGFGSKGDLSLQHHAALLAWKSNVPIRMEYSRKESIQNTTKRMPYTIWSKVGASSQGILTVAEIKIVGDFGAYISHGHALLKRAITHCAGPYRMRNIKADAYAVFTNKVPIGAMRGYGVPAVAFAIEQQINKLAKLLNMDPLGFRYKNILHVGDETITGQFLNASVGLEATLKAVASKADWPWKPHLEEGEK